MIASSELLLLWGSFQVVYSHMASGGCTIGPNQFRGRSVLSPQLIGPQGGPGSTTRVENPYSPIAVDFQKLAGHFIDFLLTGPH